MGFRDLLLRGPCGPQAEVLRQPAYHRRQVEIPVADVDGDDAAGRQVPPVNFERFTRQEVRGDRVAAEGVQHERSKCWGGWRSNDRRASPMITSQ